MTRNIEYQPLFDEGWGGLTGDGGSAGIWPSGDWSLIEGSRLIIGRPIAYTGGSIGGGIGT